MPSVSGPRGTSPIRFNTPQSAQQAWAVGTFRLKGWGLSSPLKEVTFDANGGFKASLRGGGKAGGKFEFRDGAAAFMDTLKLTDSTGKELLFGVLAQTRDANGKLRSLKLGELSTGVGRPFTLELR